MKGLIASSILYSDVSIVAIDKPVGISVLPEGWEKDVPYLVKMLEEEYARIWVVHRLDKLTSGVMVFSLTAESHRTLNIQFEKHTVEKIYHAIAVGVPMWDEKVVNFPLRVNVGHRHRTVVDDKNGVGSETRFKVLERYQANVLLEARPVTGRTHQIRVHAYAAGYPLLGDILYNAPETDIIVRPALHAYSLTINHPVSKERLVFTADYPDDFKKALERLQV